MQLEYGVYYVALLLYHVEAHFDLYSATCKLTKKLDGRLSRLHSSLLIEQHSIHTLVFMRIHRLLFPILLS